MSRRSVWDEPDEIEFDGLDAPPPVATMIHMATSRGRRARDRSLLDFFVEEFKAAGITLDLPQPTHHRSRKTS